MLRTRSKPGNYEYMAITDDEFELPIYSSDKLKNLAEIMGKDPVAVSCALHYGRKMHLDNEWCKIIKVLVEE